MTKAGKVMWERTATDDAFQVSFPSHTVRISLEIMGDSPSVVLTILNEDGSTVEQLAFDLPVSQEQGSREQQLMRIFEGARRKAMGIDKAVVALLAALEDEPTGDIPF